MNLFKKLERWPRTIRGKLITMLLLAAGLGLAVALIGFSIYEWMSLRKAMISDLATHARVLGANCAAALVFDNPKDAESVLESLRADPTILDAWVYRADGRELASYHKTTPAPPPPQLGAGFIFTRHELVLAQEITLEAQAVGKIILRSDTQPFYDRLAHLGMVFAGIFLLFLAASWLLAVSLQKWISTPLLSLVHLMWRVSANKDYSLRATKQQEDEIGLLVDGFNAMLGEIQARDTALQKARDELEQRVQERTHALAKEMAERQKAEHRFTQAFQANPLPMCVATLQDDRLLVANDSFLQLCGPAEGITGTETQAHLEFWPSAEYRQECIEELRARNGLRAKEFQFKTRTGATRQGVFYGEWMDWGGTPLRALGCV